MANTKARLNPAIWPATARTDATSGELFLGGLSVSELTERFGTPVFILDEADFRARAVKFKEAMEKILALAQMFITQVKRLPRLLPQNG